MLKRLAAVVSSNRAAYRVLRSEPGSVLHANDMEALLHTGFGAWLARVPIVLNIRDVHEPSHPYGRKWCLAQCLPSVIVALSREMKTELLARLPKAFFGKPEWDFIYSIVDPQVMRPLSAQARADLRRDLSISPDEFAIGYVANIFPKKNQLGFLREAAGLVLSSCPKARIHFLGDFRPEKNPYAGECAAAASEIDPGGDRIRFHGFKAQIGLWYQALDLIVLGSRQEGLARCMAEGIACGTPMVSFDVCSAREILEAHGCGLVVSRGDYSSMVNRIVELSEAPDRRRAMGENGAEAAAKLFAPAAAVENYRKIYQQLAAP